MKYSADGMALFALVYFILFINEHILNPYTFSELWPIGIGSFLLMFAVITSNYALAYGKAGPS